jgi:hypothetical protein
MDEVRNACKILVGKPEGRHERKRPLVRPRRRGEDNIKMDLREIGIDWANRLRQAQNMVQWQAFVKTVVNFRLP